MKTAAERRTPPDHSFGSDNAGTGSPVDHTRDGQTLSRRSSMFRATLVPDLTSGARETGDVSPTSQLSDRRNFNGQSPERPFAAQPLLHCVYMTVRIDSSSWPSPIVRPTRSGIDPLRSRASSTVSDGAMLRHCTARASLHVDCVSFSHFWNWTPKRRENSIDNCEESRSSWARFANWMC